MTSAARQAIERVAVDKEDEVEACATLMASGSFVPAGLHSRVQMALKQ